MKGKWTLALAVLALLLPLVPLAALAETYAADNGIKFIKITPDYAQYGRAATFIRNRAIIDKADCVVAVWDGQSHGTKYSMDYARKKGKPIKIFMV